jgi:predicted nucleotidyltransferase
MVENDHMLPSSLSSVLASSAFSELLLKWKIQTLAIFGSALRSDFSESSDIDFLVTFGTDAQWSVVDHMAMEREFESLLGRGVDVVTRSAIEQSANRIRREEILSSARTLYAA